MDVCRIAITRVAQARTGGNIPCTRAGRRPRARRNLSQEIYAQAEASAPMRHGMSEPAPDTVDFVGGVRTLEEASRPDPGELACPRPPPVSSTTCSATRPCPADAYYGVQTARALENFHISGVRAAPLSRIHQGVRHGEAGRGARQLRLRAVQQGDPDGHREAPARSSSTASSTTSSASTCFRAAPAPRPT